jgi:hypothetical protein
VQSYIEGVGMNRVLKGSSMHEFLVTDWAAQLAQVLAYLHGKGPILHLDLKPGNIMVTPDGRLVLIDFGISRWQADEGDSLGVTVSYAAPEQLKTGVRGKAKEVVQRRFGELPPEVAGWKLDERTDIYSYGVIMFEAAVGHVPTYDTLSRLAEVLSPHLCEIIYKCLEIDPDARYQSISALLDDIKALQSTAKPAMHKSLFTRKLAAAASVACLFASAFGLGMGLHAIQMQVLAVDFVMETDSGYVDVSHRFARRAAVELYRDGFVSPGSMARAESGGVYIADAGRLRYLPAESGGQVQDITIQPAFLRPQQVRTYGTDVYILTGVWQDGDDFLYGLIRLRGDEPEGFMLGDARFTSVRCFYVSIRHIYMVQRNEGTWQTQLVRVSRGNSDDRHVLTALPDGANALAMSPDGRIFIADGAEGIILVYEGGALNHFAGAAGDRAFIDGTAPRFYRPTRLRYHSGNVYVWDWNTLRRICTATGYAASVAGQASPAYSLNFEPGAAYEIVLPFSYLTDFIHTPEGILLSCPKRGFLLGLR